MPRYPLQPLLLPPNPVFRFYKGGAGIDALRGVAPTGGETPPEDWVASTTTVLEEERAGLAALADGSLIRDLVAADPVGYLGAEHAARWGANPAVLIKLLDTGERLAAHYHPGRAFAREHLGSSFGKTEAWIVIAAPPGAHMHLGLRRDLEPQTLAGWVARQNTEEILEALRIVSVRAGDVLLVPAGTIHTIGAGITLVELQEPADFSVVLEWQRYGVTGGEETLFLGWDLVLRAANTDATLPLRGPAGPNEPVPPARSAASTLEQLLPAEADPYFRAQRAVLNGAEIMLEPQYSVLIALSGELTLTAANRRPLRLTPGGCALIPFGAGATTLAGQGTALRCLPPAPESGPGGW